MEHLWNATISLSIKIYGNCPLFGGIEGHPSTHDLTLEDTSYADI